MKTKQFKKKYLILHGDDLGMNRFANKATLEGINEGHITSASLMAPCESIQHVDPSFLSKIKFDLGAHITLNSKLSDGPSIKPLSNSAKSLVDDNGFFLQSPVETKLRAKDEEVASEIEYQINYLKSKGFKLSHIDTHRGTITHKPEWCEIYANLANKHGLIPMFVKWDNRLEGYFKHNNVCVDSIKKYLIGREKKGEFSLDQLIPDVGGKVTYKTRVKAYEKALKSIQPGISQILVHMYSKDSVDSWSKMIYSVEKFRYYDGLILKSNHFKNIIKRLNIELVSWNDIPNLIN